MAEHELERILAVEEAYPSITVDHVRNVSIPFSLTGLDRPEQGILDGSDQYFFPTIGRWCVCCDRLPPDAIISHEFLEIPRGEIGLNI